MTRLHSMVFAIALVLCSFGRASARPLELSMTVPAKVAVGETFDVPIAVFDGRRSLVSYALRLEFDPGVVEVVAVQGGTAEGFEHSPVTDPASFRSGRVDFVGVTSTFGTTAGAFTVATVKLVALAASSEPTRIQIGVVPGSGLVTKRRFKLSRTRVLGRAKLMTVQ